MVVEFVARGERGRTQRDAETNGTTAANGGIRFIFSAHSRERSRLKFLG